MKSWSELPQLDAAKVSQSACERWASRYAKKMSPSRYNSAISLLKHTFEIAIECGVRQRNPARKLKRLAQKEKNLSLILPTKAKFKEWVGAIRDAGGRFSKDCAEFVELLTYSGLRKGEAKWLIWQHCNFEREEVIVVGDPEGGTKNSETRRVPMNSSLRDLLERIQKRRPNEAPGVSVLRVNEAQKSMDRAAEIVGIERMTHHDLRHLFATTCIESGVDIPTVAEWLGHKDGGVLAMKTYGHLRNEHSRASAKKVNF